MMVDEVKVKNEKALNSESSFEVRGKVEEVNDCFAFALEKSMRNTKKSVNNITFKNTTICFIENE